MAHLTSRGVSLIEIVIAVGLSAIILPALFYGFITVRDGRYREEYRLEAATLLKDVNEQVRAIRETSWNSLLATGITHYKPILTGSTYSLQAGNESINEYNRYLTLADVYRDDTSGAIVPTGGTLDKSTKKVASYVTWSSGGPINTVSTSYYLTRTLNPAYWEQTTQAHFDAGTKTNTETSSGGDVKLSKQSSGASWATPTLSKTVDTSGNSDGYGIAIDGNYAYLTHLGNPGLTVVNITDPPNATVSGSLAHNNIVYSVKVSGIYAYIISSKNTGEFTVANVSNKSSPTEAGLLNLAGNGSARDVALYGNYAIVARIGSSDPELQVVNITTPATPTLTSSLQDSSITYNSVAVSGQYAYAATSDNSGELKVVSLATIGTLAIVATLDLPNTTDGLAIAVSGNYAYVGTQNNTTGAEFYIIDITTPTGPILRGSYEAGGSVNGIAIDGNNAFLATSNTARDFTVVNITTKTLPSLTGFLDLTSTGNKVGVSGAYAYVSNAGNSTELFIIKGGTTQSYYTTGSFETQTFDVNTITGESDAGYTYFIVDRTTPSNTNLTPQVAVSNVAGVFNYTTLTGTEGRIPFAINTGRYVRFKFLFTSDGTDTPTLNSVRINYAR